MYGRLNSTPLKSQFFIEFSTSRHQSRKDTETLSAMICVKTIHGAKMTKTVVICIGIFLAIEKASFSKAAKINHILQCYVNAEYRRLIC